MTKKIDIDVLKHHLVPKMKIMGEKQREKIFKKYGVSKKDLPLMLADDPASKALGAEPGDIVEIDRVDATGPNKSYKLVVE